MSARDRDRLRDRLFEADSDQDRDRIRDRSRQSVLLQAWQDGIDLGEEPIYGGQVLSRQEREQHRNRLRTAATAEERERIRTEHNKQIRARAKEQGVKLGDEPVFGRAMMTRKERKRYEKQIDAAETAQARERIRDQNQQQMHVRAWERGLNSGREPVYGGHLMSQQERSLYRAQLQNASTAEERERARAEHNKQVRMRAQQQGLALGDEPVYGGTLMSDQDRDRLRQRLRVSTLAEQRERIRDASQQNMQAKVWERGIYSGREPIYGGQMMNARERSEFRNRLQSATSAEARERIRSEQQNMVMDRARQRGVAAGDPPIFGGQLMSKQERSRFQKKLARAGSAQERERLRLKNMTQMRKRYASSRSGTRAAGSADGQGRSGMGQGIHGQPSGGMGGGGRGH